MTKDVLVRVTGSHLMNEETDDISVITAGTYYFKNGKHYIVYEEHVEGLEMPSAIPSRLVSIPLR